MPEGAATLGHGVYIKNLWIFLLLHVGTMLLVLTGCQNTSTISSVGQRPVNHEQAVVHPSSAPPPTATALVPRRDRPDDPRVVRPPSQRPVTKSRKSEATRPPLMDKVIKAPSQRVRASLPNRKIQRYILSFYTSQPNVYDRPYGRPVGREPAGNFPKTKLADGGSGVPVYAIRDAFIEVPLRAGGTRWLRITDARLSGVPCATRPPTSRSHPGPIGAGSTTSDCIR